MPHVRHTSGEPRERSTLVDRALRHPQQDRPKLSEGYEIPVSDREGWWRKEIKETPNPGSYDYAPAFLDEISRRPNSYRFKSDGRKIDPHPHGKGAYLLPGAYKHQDFLYKLDKTKMTYNFKSAKRDATDILNFGLKDKDVNVSPMEYAVEKHMSLTVEKEPTKHWQFRSQDARFPTAMFKPREGPGPGNYESSTPIAKHAVSSSFRSKTARFKTSHTKTPGPGTYDKTYQLPVNTGPIRKMGRQHGLFFSCAF